MESAVRLLAGDTIVVAGAAGPGWVPASPRPATTFDDADFGSDRPPGLSSHAVAWSEVAFSHRTGVDACPYYIGHAVSQDSRLYSRK